MRLLCPIVPIILNFIAIVLLVKCKYGRHSIICPFLTIFKEPICMNKDLLGFHSILIIVDISVLRYAYEHTCIIGVSRLS